MCKAKEAKRRAKEKCGSTNPVAFQESHSSVSIHELH